MTSKKAIKVAKWIACGELDGKAMTQDDILDQCGRLLDKAYSHEIIGQVLFKATNGKHYTITVEAIISEANKEFAQDIMDDNLPA